MSIVQSALVALAQATKALDAGFVIDTVVFEINTAGRASRGAKFARYTLLLLDMDLLV